MKKKHTKKDLDISINEENYLFECLCEYQKMFPNSYTSKEQIINTLRKLIEEGVFEGEMFGIQVSEEWEDRCYGFVYLGNSFAPTFQFIGMTKS